LSTDAEEQCSRLAIRKLLKREEGKHQPSRSMLSKCRTRTKSTPA
jgi:hypothetical protein